MLASPPSHYHPCAVRERKCHRFATHLVCGSRSLAGCTACKCSPLVHSSTCDCYKSPALGPRSVSEEILRYCLAPVLRLRLLQESATRCEADNRRMRASSGCCPCL